MAEGEGMVEADWDIDFSDLSLGEEIGRGAYGIVYRGDYLGTPVAIKKILPSQEMFAKKYLEREMSTLKNIHHPLIVQFLGSVKVGSDIYLVTEWVPGGDLKAVINRGRDVLLSTKIRYMLDVARALAFLQRRAVLHRDIKPENLLIAASGQVKLCDLGFARTAGGAVTSPRGGSKGKKQMMRKTYMTIAGTDEYIAPEVILGERYDMACDVFSYGIVLGELLAHRRFPTRGPSTYFGFPDDPNEGIRSWMPEGLPPALIDLVCNCCAYESKDRPSFTDIIKQLNSVLPEVEDIEQAALAARRKARRKSSGKKEGGSKKVHVHSHAHTPKKKHHSKSKDEDGAEATGEEE